jgi:hypothetical protein
MLCNPELMTKVVAMPQHVRLFENESITYSMPPGNCQYSISPTFPKIRRV